MASANRDSWVDLRTRAAGGAVSQADILRLLPQVPFFDDTAPAFTGAPTVGGLEILLGAMTNVARTATSAGATTGTIAANGKINFVLVTATDANHIIILPAPVLGTVIVLMEVSTVGYELRSSDPATIGINGGTGSAVESAIPASTTAILVCETLTNWKGFQMSSTAGTLAKVEVAA